MPAKPRDIYPQTIRAFKAQYAAVCGECGTDIEVGDEVFYEEQVLVRVDCCVDEFQSDGSDGIGFDSFHLSRPRHIRVMPPRTTAADRCDNCFLIHSPAQNGCE